MSITIKDGTGSGNVAKVTDEKRLETSAVTETEKDHACILGDTYNINTGDITLTDANETTVLYIKNNESNPLVLTALIYNLGASTGGSGDVKINVLRNPTTGDIVTNASAVEAVSNLNYGSSKSLTADVYKGATADAVITDGTVSVSTRSASNTGRIVVSLGAVVIPQGSSLAVNYTPPASNTSQICQFAAACFVKNFDV